MKAIVRRSMCMLAAVAVILSCPFTVGSNAAAQETVGPATYPQLRLEYDSAGTADKTMSKALPLGNGFMGANVYGGVARDEIQVNEHTLWSGGPGASAAFDGGMNDLDASTVRESLMTARRGLQEEMNEFTANNKAYVDGNGKVVTSNYKSNAQYISQAIENLKGEKNNFGSYQTFGSFFIEELGKTANRVKMVASNEMATDESQKARSLFDGDASTKWYSLAGTPGGTVQNSPCYAAVWYEKPVVFSSYTIVTGNDVPGRDPKSWILYGSDNGQDWTNIDERRDQSFDKRNAAYSFSMNAEHSYEYLKFEVSEISSGNWGDGVQASELIFGESDNATSGAENYLRALDLDNGTASVDYDKDGAHYSREYFVSYPDNVAAIRYTAADGAKLNRRICFESPQTDKKIVIDGNKATLTVTGAPADQTQKRHLTFAGQLKVVLPQGGNVTADGDALVVTDAEEIAAYFTTGTNYVMCMDDTFDYFSDDDPLDAVSARVQNAANIGYDKLKAAHIADYSELFGRVKLTLGDSIVKPNKTTNKLIDGYLSGTNSQNDDRYYELLYFQFGRYLLISSSRENTLPANLQGIWCNELSPSWDSDYHTNINLQMNYWAAETTNLAECHISEIEYIKSLVPRGEITAKHYHCKADGSDVRGWTTYHENSIWGNTAPGNYASSFYFPTAAAWLCQDIYDYYAFNCDDAYLDEYYDVIKQAALFWVDNLVEDTRDGTLVSSPSYSPEHGPFSLGASADQSLIWELFRNASELAAAKGDTSSEIAEIKAAMDKLAMPQIGLGGQLMEWKDETTLDITGDNRHRHINHLLGVYPGTYIVPDRSERDNELADAVKETLRVRGDMPSEGTINWAFAWKSTVWAKLAEGDKAYADYKRLITAANNRNSVGDNLFDVYGGYVFQIDANLGGVAAVAEMLLSSTGDRIDLLAALPSTWREGSFKGLRARGDFTIDAKWSNKKLDAMRIVSGSGKPCTLAYDDVYFARITCDGKPVKFTVNADDTITFATEAGKTYEITQHTTHDVTVTGRVKHTCENTGHTGKVYCNTCQTVVTAGSAIPKKQHDYVDGVCEFCGDEWNYYPDLTPDCPAVTPDPVEPSGGEKPFPVALTVCLIACSLLCIGGVIAWLAIRRAKQKKGDK